MVLLKINGDRFLLSFYVLGITTVLNENNVGNYFCKITNPGRAGRASQPVTSDPCRQQSERVKGTTCRQNDPVSALQPSHHKRSVSILSQFASRGQNEKRIS